MSRYTDEKSNLNIGQIVRDVGITVLLFLVLVMGGGPYYNVWERGLNGEASLAQAQQTRQIAVQEAQAKKDSAVLLAEAEVARAHGVAEANKIIGESLKGNEAYLHYLWINNLSSDKEKTVVYVPTEANLPILEAGKRAQ